MLVTLPFVLPIVVHAGYDPIWWGVMNVIEAEIRSVVHIGNRARVKIGAVTAEVTDAEVLRATFPPGSVTGAPKVQSLRVIAELESAGREVYTGAVGFASPVAGLACELVGASGSVTNTPAPGPH